MNTSARCHLLATGRRQGAFSQTGIPSSNTVEEMRQIGLADSRAMVGVGGFEPPTSRSRTVRSSLTELHPDATDCGNFERESTLSGISRRHQNIRTQVRVSIIRGGRATC